jgi:hypothetical protein
MELRSWVWSIHSRCLCHSRLHSHLGIQRGSRLSTVWETNEATEEVTYRRKSRRRGTNEEEPSLSQWLASSPEGWCWQAWEKLSAIYFVSYPIEIIASSFPPRLTKRHPLTCTSSPSDSSDVHFHLNRRDHTPVRQESTPFPGLVFLVVFILQEDHLYFARSGQE